MKIMKKTYISPETIVVQLMSSSSILTGSDKDIYNEIGDGIYAKEYDGEDGSASDTNTWDDEW